MQQGNPVVLYITLGFMLAGFLVWLYQSIAKRRNIEDEIEAQKDGDNDDNGDKK